jgi:hypothetical protein
MATSEFKAPEGGIPYHYDGEGPEHPESLGDRYGEFVPQTAAEARAVDALPSHEDLLARQPRVELTEEEKEIGRAAVEKARKQLGF